MNITSTAFRIGAGATAGVAGLALGATLAFGPGPSGTSTSPVAQPATFTQAGGASTPGQPNTAGPGTARPHGAGPHGRRRPHGPAAFLGRISDGQFTLRLGKSWVTAEIVNGTLASVSGSPPTITVQPRDTGDSALTFSTDANTKVFLRGKPGTVSDLENGDHVRVMGIKQADGSFKAVRIWCVRRATPPANPGAAGAKGNTA